MTEFPHVPAPRKVIFDTDPGIDDAMALLFLSKAPGIEIVGVTTSFGNGTIEATTRNTLYLRELFCIDAPVARGVAGPLEGLPMQPPAHVHGQNALGDLPMTRDYDRAVHALCAPAFIVERVRRHPGEITLVAVARMTNLALALRQDPSIAGLVKEVIVMGGAFGFHGHSGNISPIAETNIFGDPLAADEVLGAGWPVTLVGLDVTQRTIMPASMLRQIGENGGESGKFIEGIAQFYLDFHRKSAGIDGIYVHDSSAIAYLLDPSSFSIRKGPVRVVRDGIATGQTIQKPDTRHSTFPDWENRPSQSICIDVRPDQVRDLYYRTVIAPAVETPVSRRQKTTR
jgi:inosine-uridine nucleoside N-ribohydrolase